MLKTLGKQIKEFKLVSILTPIAMLAEVIVENFIPLLMATIIDSIGSGDLNSIYRTACIMVVLAIAGLISGYLGGVFGANASAGFARNLRKTYRLLAFLILISSAQQVWLQDLQLM